ncbi:hypothetical protein [Haloarchaeobius sp. TZWWS8]|uniref:hypothetical protein n=1 Tax=Haloarchaeobius sp. TZWWS8 TaxID=3446121 RepID=UPI003EBECC7F
MSDYFCPVEGCDFGESSEKTHTQVRTHISAKGDGEHVWKDLKQVVEKQGSDATDGATTETSTDEQKESQDSDNQTTTETTVESSTSDGGSTTEEEDMATDEEIEQQWSKQESQDDDNQTTTETTIESSTQNGASDGGSDGRSGGIPIPFSTTTVLIVGVVLAVVLFWLARRRTSDELSATGGTPDGENLEESNSGGMSRQSGGGLQ